jgi:hypothetical protein
VEESLPPNTPFSRLPEEQPDSATEKSIAAAIVRLKLYRLGCDAVD